jgi:site-specific DNA recombinase
MMSEPSSEEAPMLTLGYCRVSTEEQAEDGFSVAAQADRLRMYATLKDLGDVTIITDPGYSGKDLRRPGIQQVLAAIDAGHVQHFLVWRLDRLSRNMLDFITFGNTLVGKGVTLHSVSESIDLSSASGRMMYNTLGNWAQYFREVLAENVRLGNERAIREGKVINRPKFGYDLREGQLVVNDDAPIVREIFRLRVDGHSYREIEESTGVRYSTVASVLQSRVYVGERPWHGEFLEGTHEPIVTEEEWRAANARRRRGRNTSKDPLSGHVLCGSCARRMSIQQNGQGCRAYKCRNRGQGCGMPARSNLGLARAAVLGMGLLASDGNLRESIKRQLAGGARADGTRPHGRTRRAAADVLAEVTRKRQKLLELYYSGNITQEGFAEEERRLLDRAEAAGVQVQEEERSASRDREALERFAQLEAILTDLDVDLLWSRGTDQERRVLIDEFLEAVTVFEDHLEVKIANAPPLKVLLGEVGLKESESVGVGGGT